MLPLIRDKHHGTTLDEQPHYRIYICTNTHCTANGMAAVYRAFEQALDDAQLADAIELRPSGCQNGCEYGPNAVIWPGPIRYRQLTPAQVRQIIAELQAKLD